MYYDDVEVANPLGSRAGNHKLGMCSVMCSQSVSLTHTSTCTHFFAPPSHSLFVSHSHASAYTRFFAHTQTQAQIDMHVLVHVLLPFLGCFYFTIANIQPKYRSSLKSIFLLAIAKSSLLKEFTADAILTKFTMQMNELSQVIQNCYYY